MLLFIVIFGVVVAAGLGLAAAWSDLRGLIIPNAYPAGILIAFVPVWALVFFFAPASGFFGDMLSHLLSFALVLAGSFVLFSLKMFGAGDSKLASAYALWVGTAGLPAFVFYMAMVGGLLGLVTLAFKKFKPLASPPPGTWLARAQEGDNAVPYGIAITAGALISFVWLGYFSPGELARLAG